MSIHNDNYLEQINHLRSQNFRIETEQEEDQGEYEEGEECKDWTDAELKELPASERRRMASEAMNIKDTALLPKKILLNANMTEKQKEQLFGKYLGNEFDIRSQK